ncbi:MAG: hypothetical protein H6729_06955 [Deltaproteobacteria bacterium]|nr:hypothetical protein [Deltaproteobacteria bacterium]
MRAKRRRRPSDGCLARLARRLVAHISLALVALALVGSAPPTTTESQGAKAVSPLVLVEDVKGREALAADLDEVSRALCESVVSSAPAWRKSGEGTSRPVSVYRVICDADRRALLRLKALSTQIQGVCSAACQADLAALENIRYTVSAILSPVPEDRVTAPMVLVVTLLEHGTSRVVVRREWKAASIAALLMKIRSDAPGLFAEL